MRRAARRRWVVRARLGAAAALVALAAGCRHAEARDADPRLGDADPERGRMLMHQYGCGSCHQIPGVDGAAGMVGPPLDHWSRRRYIGGHLENTPERLVTWITVPQAVDPGNAMPNMGVTDAQARAMAAYLYTLK